MQSPYRASVDELVLRFGTTARRSQYLRGLLNLRRDLRAQGIEEGQQWIDGSFVEDKEARGLEPGDIDIVTLFERPVGMADSASWAAFSRPLLSSLFNPAFCKAAYNCEAFYIDLGLNGVNTARQSAFWFGLFSHQRATFRWKGVVEIPLGPTAIDISASDELTRRGF